MSAKKHIDINSITVGLSISTSAIAFSAASWPLALTAASAGLVLAIANRSNFQPKTFLASVATATAIALTSVFSAVAYKSPSTNDVPPADTASICQQFKITKNPKNQALYTKAAPKVMTPCV